MMINFMNRFLSFKVSPPCYVICFLYIASGTFFSSVFYSVFVTSLNKEILKFVSICNGINKPFQSYNKSFYTEGPVSICLYALSGVNHPKREEILY